MNSEPLLFTPGPPPTVVEGLQQVKGAFGRGDPRFQQIREEVYSWIRGLTGHPEVVSLQGSGTLAIEIMIRNFVRGKVLVVNSGFYSERIYQICKAISNEVNSCIESVSKIDYHSISQTVGSFDWIVSVYVETSVAFKQEIPELRSLADRCEAKLAIDAVASIGLESNHQLADVAAFSSCKGLFGITGAAFLSFRVPPENKVSSFYLDIESHINHLMTGPYAQIQYLYGIKDRHTSYLQAVKKNKEVCLSKFRDFLVNPERNEPLLCTQLSRAVIAKSPEVILYKPRSQSALTVVNHLGEINLGESAEGKILDLIEVISE